MAALPLKETQILLWNLITAPEGVHKALADRGDKGLPIKPSATMTPAERLDIYANMYFYRILDSLKEDFPQVLESIGEGLFHNLITDYLLKHPSSHYSLRYVGQHLPDFLQQHSLAKDYPHLVDLARLEYALLESFDASDEKVMKMHELQQVAPEQWGDLYLQLAPPVILLKGQWSEGPVIVWRQDFQVYYRHLDDVEHRLLSEAQDGRAFAELCEHATEFMDPQEVVTRLAGYLQGWVSNEWIKSSFCSHSSRTQT
jgi:hypothetical protein